MQRQVLEGFDLRGVPAVLLRPAYGQHVVGELFAEQQGGRVGLRLAFWVSFDGEICCLERKRSREAEEGEGRGRSRGDEATSTTIVSELVIDRACFRQIYWSYRTTTVIIQVQLN